MRLSLHTPAMRRLHTLNIAVCNAKHRKLISGDTFSKEVVGGIMRRLRLYRLSIDGKCWEVGLTQFVLEGGAERELAGVLGGHAFVWRRVFYFRVGWWFFRFASCFQIVAQIRPLSLM